MQCNSSALVQKNNFLYSPIPQTLLNKSSVIASTNLPQHMKDSLIHALLINHNKLINNADNTISIDKNQNNTCSPRILFSKEEDERIKILVNIFGTRHWDLIAQFIEGRTAKQCRDRYSNYLVPGYFQGEWSEDEDSLLIKLYNEHGPKWSQIQKSFKNRSSNNIKNRWNYFVHRNFQITNIKKKKEENNKQKDKDIKTRKIEDNNPKGQNYFCEDDENNFQILENEFYDSFNNSEYENDYFY